MRVVEALITLEVVEEEVAKVEEEVATTQGATPKAVGAEVGGSARLLDAIEFKDVSDS